MAQALNKFGIKDFAKMIPSAPIFPLSLSNSLSFALVKIEEKKLQQFQFSDFEHILTMKGCPDNFCVF